MLLERYRHRLTEFDALMDRAESLLERRAIWAVVLFTVFYAGLTCVLSTGKLLWCDEIFTFHLARVHSVARLWEALQNDVDYTPPFLFLITRASFALFGESAFAARLPEMAGFWVMSMSLYAFVRHRCNPVYAWIAALLPMATGAYPYAYEARAYGIVLGGAGMALACWQRAADRESGRTLYLAGLACGLSIAITSHFYGFLVVFPFVLAEFGRSWQRRRVDLPVAGAIALSLTAFIPVIILMFRLRQYTATFWATASWTGIQDYYTTLLRPGLLIFLVVLAIFAFGLREDRQLGRTRIPVWDWAVAFGFSAIPVLAVAIGIVATGVFASRYALPGVIGISVLLGLAAAMRHVRRAPVAALLALMVYLGFTGAREMRLVLKKHGASPHVFNIEGTDAVVVQDPRRYVQMAWYAPPELASRLFYIADPEQALRYTSFDTLDRNLRELQKFTTIQAPGIAEFLSKHPEFLLYWDAQPPEGTLIGWHLPYLLHRGSRIQLDRQEGSVLIFRISATP